MKKMILMSLMALASIGMQAQNAKDMKVRAFGRPTVTSTRKATVDPKTKLKVIDLSNTENNSWHENINLLNNVSTVKDITSVFPEEGIIKEKNFTPLRWMLADEGKNTVLHCYILMKADIMQNLWLASEETTILDKETGIIYQVQSTVPERCFNKVFGVKGKEGTVLDLKIMFPRIPDSATDLVIYGVPFWRMRGLSVKENATTINGERMSDYDSTPKFHMAHMVKDSVNYNKNDQMSWAVYKDAHLIKPVKEETMALWLTPEATYLAIATEQNWLREYYGRGGNTILMDNQGHQYKCKGVLGYPNDPLFWLEGYPGDYFAFVLVFEPLPHYIRTFTYIVPEGEPFNAWGANWQGDVKANLDVKQLRENQKLFEYRPRVLVK